MNKTKKEACLSAMVAYLKEQKEGYTVNTHTLISLACPGEEDPEELALAAALPARAKKEGLLLDSEYSNGEPVGMPQDIPFSVYRKSSRPRCPFCGSLDTAPILYGYPAPFAEAEQAEHRFYLGGCFPKEETHRCFRCNRNFI